MRNLPWGWIIAALAVTILVGTVIQGRRTWAEILEENREYAERVARAEQNQEVAQEAYTRMAQAEEGVRDSAQEAELRHERHERTLRGQLRVAIRNQAPALADSFDAMTAASDSSLLACRERCSSFERQLQASAELHVTKDSTITALRDDRDFWKQKTKEQTTEWSLVGWLPKGPWRIVGTVVICGGAGVAVGVPTDSPEAGAGVAGGCVLGAAAF